MLTITPQAWRAIDALTHEHQAAGLRVARSDSGSLSLDVAAGPEHDDTVVWSRGTVVYIDRQAAAGVDDAVLDLRATPGSRAFYLR
ncbi:MAG: iron-sulfur cluster assembly protein [Frankiales bacterium]|nr:iron-sulfur cluster assembly protein [Frankiales bacterium]MDX6268167.1 iron-sulfur cluster assembly protein [Frankiales bacterium]